ncbi:MAG: serine hydroxymethyltransferase [Candidatus Buchananbacteria bacterium]|nr:serine hydroxymethyltransferase [Candidatus Buchananbacteria bacterium]
MSQHIQQLIKKELQRQQSSLVMIASENYASPAVLAATGSVLTNKYSEGYPNTRYYTGNEFIDQIESAAQSLALKIFKLSEKNWHANVQPHSGSSANLAVYNALLKPGDTILAMDLAAGGHLTHGSPVSLTGKLYNFVHYGVDPKTHRLDYKVIEELAIKHQPKLIVCGATAYPRQIDFKKFAAIAKHTNSLLMADIAHIAGLVVGGVHPSPFPHADIVTSTTHKTLGGPRSAIIICKKEYQPAIDRAVFPGMQGGPLDHVIAAKAICFEEALTAKFKQRQQQTVKNTKALAEVLTKRGLSLITNGSDNHLLIVDCRPLNLSGKDGANLLAEAGIYTNANMVPFDTASPRNPSGIRIGTQALATRGLKERELRTIGLWISEILLQPTNKQLRSRIKKEVSVLMKSFPIYT